MRKGTFVNYQLAEVLLELEKYKQNNNGLAIGFESKLDELKKDWVEKDIIPSLGINVPPLFSMQQLTVDELEKISKELEEFDTFTVENCAGMQNVVSGIDSEGNYTFDFSSLDYVIEFAKSHNKKIIIDSAIVHGDHYPNQFKGLDETQLSKMISDYIKALVQKCGDIIERIDVLNAVYDRKEVMDNEKKESVDDFWKRNFGEEYGKAIIDICKSSLGDKKIPLCWNEFYITNKGYLEKGSGFLRTVSTIDNLDVIGIQDAYPDTTDLEHVIEVMNTVEAICKEKGKKFSITELSCILSHKTVEELYTILNSNPEKLSETRELIEDRVNKVIENVTKYSAASEYCTSIEGRLSKELDYYSHRDELVDFNRITGSCINTVGYNWKDLVKSDIKIDKLMDEKTIQ